MIIAEPRPNDRQPCRMRSSVWWLVCVSVLAHVAIAVILSVSFKNERHEIKSPAEPIQARIIYPELPTEIEPIPSPTPLPTQEEDAEPVDETITENDIPTAEVTEPEDDVAVTEESAIVESLESSIEENEPLTPSNDVLEERQAIPRTQSITRGATKRFLQQQQQTMLDKTAEQASAEFRRQISSPDLNLPEIDFEVSQAPGKPIIVACNKTAVNVLRILSQIAGGTLRCRDESNVDEFIQRRIEKRQ